MAIVNLGAKRLQGLKIDRTNDSLGSDANGANTGITLIDINGYATFDGSNSYISTSWSPNFQIGDEFSVSLWFKSSSTTFQTFINQWGNQNGSNNNGWLLIDKGTAASFRFASNWGNGNAIRLNTGTNSKFSDGNWHHLVVTYNGGGHTGVIFYLDGAVESATADITGTVGSITYSKPVEIGAYSSTHTDKYNGSMKQVLVYTDVLSSSEVTTLYNSGSPIVSPSTSSLVTKYDLISNANDSQGSNNGTATSVTFTDDAYKLGTGAYSFDGTDDYVVLTDVGTNGIDTTGDLSIVGWINLNATNANQAIISNDSNSSSAGINLYVHSTNQLRFGGGSAGTQVTGSTGKFTAGTWYHVAVVKSGANCSLYVDGVQDGSTQTDWGTIDGQAQATIGAQYSGSAYGDDFNGKIDDLAIYKRALTTTEIGKLANNNASANMGFYAANANQSCADGKFTFDLQRKVGTDTSSWDLYDDVPTSLNETSWTSANTVSDSQWTLRAKIRFTSIGDDENWCWIALTRNYYGFTSNDAIGSSYGIGVQFRFGTSLNTYYTNDLVASGTSFAAQKGTGDNSQNWTPEEDTDYYLEIKRTSPTAYSVSMFEGSDFSTDPIGTITGACSDTITKLKYIKVMNTYVNPAGTGSDIEGYVSWWKFYDGTNSPSSGTLTKTYEFVDGDAQLVSSLSDKSNLKANYTMDSLSLGATGTTTTTTSGATQQGAQSGSNQTTAHVTSGSNTGLKFTSTHSGTGAAIGTFDLGSALASKWIAQVSFTTGSGYTSSGNGMFAFGISDKSTYSSSEHMNDNSSGDTVNWIWHLGASNDRTQRIRTILNGSGSDGSNGTSRAWEDSTTFYFEMSYDGSTVTAQRKTDDTYATNHSQSAITKSTSGITGLQYFNWGSTDDGGSQGGFNVTLNTLKIYDGVSSLDGCKNDFSATTALDGQTNLPVNTIFEQTDDTPSYWWKQSDNTWKKDPKATVEENFSSSLGWTLSNSAISNNSITCTGSGESYKAITGIGKPDKLTWDFTWTRNSGDQGNTSSFLLTNHTGGYSDPSSGQTNVQFYMPNGNATWLSVRKNSGSGNVQTECNLSSGIQDSGTTKYYRITKDGTLWTVKRFGSTSDREGNSNVEDSATATMSSSADSTWNSGSGDLTYILVDGHGSGTKNYTISDVKIWKDVAL